MFHRGLDHLSQAIQSYEVAFLKSAGPSGEQLEYTVHFLAADQRHHHYGCDTDCLTTFPVYPRVVLRVVATQNLAGADTFSRKTRIDLQVRSQFRRGGTRTGAADHGLALAQRDGGSGRSRDVLCRSASNCRVASRSRCAIWLSD